MTLQPLSIYIHWPFCKSKCPYCDFFKRISKNVNQDDIIEHYLQNLDYYHQLVPERMIRSVFFGGGTPSLIEPKQINRLLEHIAKLWAWEEEIEISLEANPNSEYRDMFYQLRQAGINRLSLGVQALNDEDLKFLGRTHNLNQAQHSIEEVLQNFDNHSIDLIYARPNQKQEDWQKELETAAALGLKHLSLYQLTIEEGTVFANRNIHALEENQAVKMYLQTVRYLREKGYPRYEVSNFSSPQYESKHNKCYWLGNEYIGIGESAHGRLKMDSSHLAVFHPPLTAQSQHAEQTALNHGIHFEKISDNERAEELIIMGLRLQNGIDKKHFTNICGLRFEEFANSQALNELVAMGLIENNAEYIRATDNGFLVLDTIIEKLCS